LHADAQIVAVKTPHDEKEVDRILFSGIGSRAFSQHDVAYDTKAKEAASAAKPLTHIQKTNPATAEKLKAFLTTKALDESKVGLLPPIFTPSTRNADMRPSSVEQQTGKILAIAPVVP
jgi:hypothetical protein